MYLNIFKSQKEIPNPNEGSSWMGAPDIQHLEERGTFPPGSRATWAMRPACSRARDPRKAFPWLGEWASAERTSPNGSAGSHAPSWPGRFGDQSALVLPLATSQTFRIKQPQLKGVFTVLLSRNLLTPGRLRIHVKRSQELKSNLCIMGDLIHLSRLEELTCLLV